MNHTSHLDTEEDTKNQCITPALRRAGWKAASMLMEYSLRADRRRIVPGRNTTTKEARKGPNRPDYILCHGPDCPIAIIEAKKSSLPDYEGLDQAKAYAQLLDVPFAYASSGHEFVEWDASTGQERHIALDAFPSPEELWTRWCAVRGVQPKERTALDKAQYYTTAGGWRPRYYQMKAINRAVEAVIVGHRRRLLLCMATGTGKTYTAFQIVWRLRKAGVVTNVLYLADRNQLIDQPLSGDFAPLAKHATKIQHGRIDTAYELYFGLYQQLAGGQDSEDGEGTSALDNFRQVPPDYFDLIIVDECHRGSARAESSWREILEYFAPAIQIGMTATPNEAADADNARYFGDPIFTYSLREGIEDGFLAPYQVISVQLDKDRDGWEPELGELDDLGQPIPPRRYTLTDFGTTLDLRQRNLAVARAVTEYLQHVGRYSKTIIFCTTQRHALSMLEAIRACNADICRESPNYAVRMTANDETGISYLDDFTSVDAPLPVIATTSKLLSTGVDTKCVKLIVLDANIRSMTEFKQIIGRGTRLREDVGKTFFTIMDFRGVCGLFRDPAFDGPPDVEEAWRQGDPPPCKPADRFEKGEDASESCTQPGGEEEPPADAPRHYVVSGVSVQIVGRSVSYLDENGRLVTEKFEDYTRRNLLRLFGDQADFVELWNGPEEKQAIIKRLEAEGILVEQLKVALGEPDVDEFDLICSIAYGQPPMTRHMRANRVRQGKFLEKYQGIARDILESLLDVYARLGVAEIDDITVLQNQPMSSFGGVSRIVGAFGGTDAYKEAVRAMQRELYLPPQDLHASGENLNMS